MKVNVLLILFLLSVFNSYSQDYIEIDSYQLEVENLLDETKKEVSEYHNLKIDFPKKKVVIRRYDLENHNFSFEQEFKIVEMGENSVERFFVQDSTSKLSFLVFIKKEQVIMSMINENGINTSNLIYHYYPSKRKDDFKILHSRKCPILYNVEVPDTLDNSVIIHTKNKLPENLNLKIDEISKSYLAGSWESYYRISYENYHMLSYSIKEPDPKGSFSEDAEKSCFKITSNIEHRQVRAFKLWAILQKNGVKDSKDAIKIELTIYLRG